MQPSGGATKQMEHSPWWEPWGSLLQAWKIAMLTGQRTGGTAGCRQVGMPRIKLWKENPTASSCRKMGIIPFIVATKVQGHEKWGLERLPHFHQTCYQLPSRPCWIWAPWWEFNPSVLVTWALGTKKSLNQYLPFDHPDMMEGLLNIWSLGPFSHTCPPRIVPWSLCISAQVTKESLVTSTARTLKDVNMLGNRKWRMLLKNFIVWTSVSTQPLCGVLTAHLAH